MRSRVKTNRAISVVGALVLLWLTLSLLATSTRAEYAISIAQGNVAVDITGDLAQGVPLSNVNSTSGFGEIPVFHASLEGENASQLSTLLSGAIRAKASSANVNHVKFSAESNGTLMHYELSFGVTNVSKTTGGMERVDLSWRAFAIEDDFGADSVSVNKIVPNYLQMSILQQAESTGGPPGIQQVKTWYFNSRPTPAARVPSQTQNLELFNFTSLAQPLQNWRSQQDLSNSKVLLRSDSGFNITFVDRVTEGEITTTFALNAINNVRATIEAPLPARVTDDQLVFETVGAAWKPQLMLASIVSGLALLLGTYIAEKRIQHRTPPRRARKPKR